MPVLSQVRFADTPFADCFPSAEEMAAFDAKTIQAGTQARALMESAGRKCAGVIQELYGEDFGPEHPIVILCGPGNNGGDGLVIARYLRSQGAQVSVIISYAQKYSAELTAQISRYVAEKQQFLFFSAASGGEASAGAMIDRGGLVEALNEAWIVVDAMLGSGQKEAPRGEVKAMIECLAQARGEGAGFGCISVDVPTGINASTGEVHEPHVAAGLTLCIELLKRGLTQYPARALCGEIRVLPIGIDCSGGCEFQLLYPGTLEMEIPPRAIGSNKGDFGKVFVIGGSRKMPGAPVLAAHAAYASGAGLVTQTEFLGGSVLRPPEIMLEPFDTELCPAQVAELCERMRKSDAIVLGPGLGQSAEKREAIGLLLEVISAENLRAVVDADALNALSELARAGGNFRLLGAVLTPHPGEMARLLGCSIPDVQRDRFGAVKALARKFECVAVLKGPGTLVYSGDRGFVNPTGNPFMATGGSGDVLSGVIGAFMGQGMPPSEAAQRGVYLHGEAGDKALEGLGSGPLMASDIIGALRSVLGAKY